MSSTINRGIVSALLVTTSLVALAASPACAQSKKAFDIPAEPAILSIPEFGRQSGVEYLVHSADLQGVNTNAVTGSLAPQEALQRMFVSTPLAVRTNSDGRALIVRVSAQEAAGSSANAAPAAKPADETVVVVTGFKKSYADAVKTKRKAIEITDSISSDGLGRFPDLNVGEAIQRIPGVQINREGDSRTASINLRGLPGTYARTTMNGMAFADPVLGGNQAGNATPFGAFNSDIFSAITIIKSPTAADPSGGLSGIIDLRVAPALSRKDGGSIKIAEEYDELGKYTSPGFTLSYNKHFSPDFAVFGTIATEKQNFRRDTIQANTWAKPTVAQIQNLSGAYLDYYAPIPGVGSCATTQVCVAGGTGAKGTAGIFIPTQERQFLYDNHGTQTSLSTGFEWKVNDNFKLGTTGFFTKNDLDGVVQQFLIVDSGSGTCVSGNCPQITLTGTPYTLNEPNGSGGTIANSYVNSYSFKNSQVQNSTRQQPVFEQTWGINPTLEWKNAEWRLTGTATISRAQATTNQLETDAVQQAQGGAGNGVTGSYSTGGSNLLYSKLVLNTPLNIGPGPYTANNSTSVIDAAPVGDTFVVTGSNGTAKNSMDALQADVERDFAGGFLSSLQFGMRYESDKYVSTGSRNSAYGINTANINSSLIITNPQYAGDFFSGTAPGYTSNWVGVNSTAVLAAVMPLNYSAPGVPANLLSGGQLNTAGGFFLTPYGLINDPTNANFFAANFTNQNKISSAYVMGNFATDLGSVPVRGNFGVRLEDTKNTINALDRLATAPATYAQHTYNTHYSNVLPSFMVAADLTDKLVMRFAAYSTLVRPQPRDNIPSTQVTAPTSGNVYTVVLGSVGLKPYTANSYDLSFEWYNRPNGLISLDIYEKDIKNIIEPITDLARLCPSNGLIDSNNYGFGSLSVIGGQCTSSSLLVAGVPAVVNISGNTNGLPLKVNGIEFNAQENLDFLPAPWSNLGGAFNYAYTKISGTNTNGTPATLAGVSKNNVNLIGYYEGKSFGVRLVYNYRDRYDLVNGNTFLGAGTTVKPRGQLDGSATWHISDRIDLSFDGFNLTNANLAQYSNDPMHPRILYHEGRTYQATLRATF